MSYRTQTDPEQQTAVFPTEGLSGDQNYLIFIADLLDVKVDTSPKIIHYEVWGKDIDISENKI